VASDEPAEAVGDDAFEPQWQLADVRQHVSPAVVAPARSGANAAGAGRSELGWGVHGGLLSTGI
jgi:hypothetical protein